MRRKKPLAQSAAIASPADRGIVSLIRASFGHRHSSFANGSPRHRAFACSVPMQCAMHLLPYRGGVEHNYLIRLQ